MIYTAVCKDGLYTYSSHTFFYLLIFLEGTREEINIFNMLMEKENINKDFIYAFEFSDVKNRFEYRKVPIEKNLKHEEIRKELQRMKSDNSVSIKSLVEYFRRVVRYYGPLNYCNPYEYYESYIQGDIIDLYLQGNEFSDNSSAKNSFLFEVERWFDAYNYYQTIDEIIKNNNIKVWSTDKIGWSTFDYDVHEDLKVYISTNFGYGNSSYFLLSLRYKGLMIYPYTYIVDYYHVAVAEFKKCTMPYKVKRESWMDLLSYLVDASNLMQENPDKFVEKYIYKEIENTVADLTKIVSDYLNGIDVITYWYKVSMTTKIMDGVMVTIKKSDAILSAWDMTDSDKKDYEAYPKEMDLVIVAEKITNAMAIFDDIETYIEVYDKAKTIKPKLITLYERILPKIKDQIILLSEELDRLSIKLNKLYKEYNELNEKKNDLNEKIQKFEKYQIIREEYEKLMIVSDNNLNPSISSEKQKEHIDSFNEKYPEFEALRLECENMVSEYKKWKREYEDIVNDMKKIDQKHTEKCNEKIRRSNFKSSLEDSLEKYHKLCEDLSLENRID